MDASPGVVAAARKQIAEAEAAGSHSYRDGQLLVAKSAAKKSKPAVEKPLSFPKPEEEMDPGEEEDVW